MRLLIPKIWQLTEIPGPGIAELAAGYLFAIAKIQAFVGGNKRTAWVTCNIFIEINGGELVFDKLEAVKYVEGVASGTIDYDGVRDWIAGRLIAK